MKLTWKKKQNSKKRQLPSTSAAALPFDQNDVDSSITGEQLNPPNHHHQNDAAPSPGDTAQLADSFQAQGDKFAQDGRFREALGKWEAALNLLPERAVLHEQKAQVLLEIGESWKALKAATRATELEPSWAEVAWVTLGRSQLNFGEPDSAMESFDRALAIKPDLNEARDDRQTASNLLKKRKLLHLSGLSNIENRYMVGDKAGSL